MVITNHDPPLQPIVTILWVLHMNMTIVRQYMTSYGRADCIVKSQLSQSHVTKSNHCIDGLKNKKSVNKIMVGRTCEQDMFSDESKGAKEKKILQWDDDDNEQGRVELNGS